MRLRGLQMIDQTGRPRSSAQLYSDVTSRR
jgi:hypothetical protein